MGLTAEQKALYMAMGLAGELVRRDPGQIGGQQFIVDGVEDCVVEVLDHTAQVTVDDAKRCTITIGPCEDSLFVRDCEDCVVHAVCRQLRTRNCVRCKFYLWVLTDPIIESSHSCEFGEWNTAYPRLDAHFKAANLDASEENLCHKIYDFTPEEPNAPHWTKAPPEPERVLEVQKDGSPPVNPAPPKIAAPPAAERALPPVPAAPDAAERPLPPEPSAVHVEYASTDETSSDEGGPAATGTHTLQDEKASAVGTTIESFVHEGGPGSPQPIDITFKEESLGLSLVGCDGNGDVVASPDVVCAAVIVTAIRPESELHGVAVDIRGRMVCAVDGRAVNGLSFHETIERVLEAGRPVTISLGTPPFTLREDSVAMAVQPQEAGRHPDQVSAETGGVLAHNDSPGTQPEQVVEEQLPYRLTDETGNYVALDSVGFLGQSIRAAPTEQSRRYGRVRKGMQLHALATMLRRRTDESLVPGESPGKFLEDETHSEVWIRVHYLAAPRCEGWALVRRATKVYMTKQDDPTSPSAAPSGDTRQPGGMSLFSRFRTKKGISRKEAENVRQLILERERESMRELLAEELEERGVGSQQKIPHYQAVAVVAPGEKMNVDVGGLGVMSVTVPKRCQKGETFLFTLPAAAETTVGGSALASAPAPSEEHVEDVDGGSEVIREWVAATSLRVGDAVDVMPSSMAKSAVEEAGLKFNKAREQQCKARGIVTEMTISGNAKVKFLTPVIGPDGELIRTDTAQLTFPLTALAVAAPGTGDITPVDPVPGAGLDLSAMEKAPSSAVSSPASEAFGTPAGVDFATVRGANDGEHGIEADYDTPPTPGTPNVEPPVEETPARGHLTGLDAREIEIGMDPPVDVATVTMMHVGPADEAAAMAKAAQAARLSEMEQARPVSDPVDGGTSLEMSEGMLLMQHAQALAGEDQWAACVQTVRRAIDAGVEEVAAALYLEGVAQAEQGNLSEAVHALRQCVQAEPEHEWAKDELADLESQLQQQQQDHLESETERQNEQLEPVDVSSFGGTDDLSSPATTDDAQRGKAEQTEPVDSGLGGVDDLGSPTTAGGTAGGEDIAERNQGKQPEPLEMGEDAAEGSPEELLESVETSSSSCTDDLGSSTIAGDTTGEDAGAVPALAQGSAPAVPTATDATLEREFSSLAAAAPEDDEPGSEVSIAVAEEAGGLRAGGV